MWGLYGIELGTGNVVGGIQSQSLNWNPDVMTDTSSGDVWPRLVAIRAMRPAAQFATRDLRSILSAVPTTGLDISTLSGGLILYAQKQADGSDRATGSVHRSMAIAKGLISPRGINTDHQGDAVWSGDVMPTWDGNNDPIILTPDSALPTAPNDDAWTIGDIKVGGVTLTRCRRWGIDFGLTASTEGADSDIYDRESRIATITPTITLEGIDLGWWGASSIPTDGLQMVHTDTELFFRKRKKGSKYVDYGIAEHIVVTMAGLAVVNNIMDAAGAGLATCDLLLTGSYDGTNEPILITVDETNPRTP